MSVEFIIGIFVYLMVGGIILAWGEENEYLIIKHQYGYFVFPVLWLPIVISVGSYLLAVYIIRKMKGR